MGRGEEKGSSFDLSTLRSNKTNLYEDKEKKQNPLKKKLPASGKKSCQFVGYPNIFDPFFFVNPLHKKGTVFFCSNSSLCVFL